MKKKVKDLEYGDHIILDGEEWIVRNLYWNMEKWEVAIQSAFCKNF